MRIKVKKKLLQSIIKQAMQQGSKDIIAVDFDGTIVSNQFPQIGQPLPGALQALKKLKQKGKTLILWTCRIQDKLDQAVNFLNDTNVKFDYVNQNVPSLDFDTSDKIYRDVYIDDKGLEPIDWPKIYQQLTGQPLN